MKKTHIAAPLATSLLIAVFSASFVIAAEPQDNAFNKKGNEIFSKSNAYPSKDGQVLYESICQGCHMPQGKGAHSGAGMYPTLANNPRVAAPSYPAFVVVNGLRGMPNFAADLDDEQVAAVSNYVSTHFGNKSTDKLTAKDVQDMRPKAKGAGQIGG